MAYLIQFGLIYLFSGILKSGPTWTTDYTAVSLALSLEIWSRPLGAWLNQFDAVTRWLTIITPPVEIYGPLLLILPFWSGAGRMIAWLAFTSLQLGINLTMQMGLFGPVMIGISIALLPAWFWDRLAEPAGQRLSKKVWGRTFAANPIAESPPRSSTSILNGLGLVGRRVRDLAVIVLIVFVVFWNIESVSGTARPYIPRAYTQIVPALGLDQYFNFFAPDPETDDGWFVILGELKNGKRVNAFTGESTVSFDHPSGVYNTYLGQRWSAFLICLWTPNCNPYLEPFTKYLAREWNRHHSGDEQMQSIEITFMHSYVGPGHTRSDVTPETIWTQRF